MAEKSIEMEKIMENNYYLSMGYIVKFEKI